MRTCREIRPHAERLLPEFSSVLDASTCRSMRHTFASNAFHYGMDVKTLASTIGHESVETTLNVYAHSSEQMKRDAAKKIDEAIGLSLVRM